MINKQCGCRGIYRYGLAVYAKSLKRSQNQLIVSRYAYGIKSLHTKLPLYSILAPPVSQCTLIDIMSTIQIVADLHAFDFALSLPKCFTIKYRHIQSVESSATFPSVSECEKVYVAAVGTSTFSSKFSTCSITLLNTSGLYCGG